METKKLKGKKVAIIGAGISGLSAACYLSKMGATVEVFERHNIPGGRARQFKTSEGFVFDMGPSWYWMPDILEDFFNDFGYTTSDFYKLISLNPQFEMVFKDAPLQVPETYDDLRALFERLELGAGKQLDKFMIAAQFKYEVGMRNFVNKPCHNWSEFFSLKLLGQAVKLDLLSDFRSYVAKFFKHEKLRLLMEFPVIFLGAAPQNIPALYSLMNFGGYALGTHYPIGGFFQLVLAMEKIAKSLGVRFHYNSEVTALKVENNSISYVEVGGLNLKFDFVVGAGDYHHMETLLPDTFNNYNEDYWEKRTFAPSCLIYYIGLNKKLPQLLHHTLFFESDLDQHIGEIYDNKKWPDDPLFYVCCPSKTDKSVGPEGCENLFLLMPLAIGLEDNEATREAYFEQMIQRIEKKTNTSHLKDAIVYKKSYCVSDFKKDYYAYGGNAYGLANTLNQTAVLKPKIRNKKIKNLLYAGQLTVPGPGVPPSLISGKIVATEISKF